MTSSSKVATYLERYKIGALFEEMMTRLTKDQPEDPYPYLVTLIERKAKKPYGSLRNSSERSRGSSKSRKPPLQVSNDQLRQTAPVRSSKHLSDSNQKLSKTGTSKMSTSKSLQDFKTNTNLSFTNHDSDSENTLPTSHYPLPEEDTLAGELQLIKSVPKDEMVDDRIYKKRPKNRRHHVHLKNQELQKNERNKIIKKNHVFEQVEIYESDNDPDAVELDEDLEELKKEGAWNLKTSDNRHRQQVMRNFQNKEPLLKISICARCASIMSGGEPSSKIDESDIRYADSIHWDEDTDQDIDENRPYSSMHSSPGVDDDLFESVSMVSGPRHPVWSDESGSEISHSTSNVFRRKSQSTFKVQDYDTSFSESVVETQNKNITDQKHGEDILRQSNNSFYAGSDASSAWTMDSKKYAGPF